MATALCTTPSHRPRRTRRQASPRVLHAAAFVVVVVITIVAALVPRLPKASAVKDKCPPPAYKIFNPNDPDIFGKTARQWQTTWIRAVMDVPLDVPHPMAPANPEGCLPYTVDGAYILTGDFTPTGVSNKLCLDVVTTGAPAVLSVYNQWGFYAFPSDFTNFPPLGLGYPANSASGATFLGALLKPCASNVFLQVEGDDVTNTANFYRTSDPQLFPANITRSFLNIQAYPTDQPELTDTPTYGAGWYAVLQFKKARTYLVRFGLSEACTIDLKTPTKPFKWIFTDAAGTPQPPVKFTSLEPFIPLFGLQGTNGVFDRAPIMYQLTIKVREGEP